MFCNKKRILKTRNKNDQCNDKCQDGSISLFTADFFYTSSYVVLVEVFDLVLCAYLISSFALYFLKSNTFPQKIRRNDHSATDEKKKRI